MVPVEAKIHIKPYVLIDPSLFSIGLSEGSKKCYVVLYSQTAQKYLTEKLGSSFKAIPIIVHL